jgi:hypothetical protein
MNIQDLERRVRAATSATAQEIDPGTIAPLSLAGQATRSRPGTAGSGRGWRGATGRGRLWLARPRLIAPAAAAAAVLAVIAAALVITGGPHDQQAGGRPAGPAAKGSAAPSASPTARPTPTPRPISPAAALASVQGATSVNCNNAIVDAVSGNPVTDCDVIWKHTFGRAAPRLAVYADDGWFLVLPATQRPPAGSVRLPSGVVMNTNLIVLNEWLQDYVSGLNSQCYASSAAVTAVHGELASLGLSGWNVSAQPPAANGTTTCDNVSIISAGQRTVQLKAPPSVSSGNGPASQMQQFAGALHQISNSCLDLPAATEQVTAAAARYGQSLSPPDSLQQVTVPDAHCTSVYLEIGGAMFVTLRGPEALAP